MIARTVADANQVAAFASLVPSLEHPARGLRAFGTATAVVTGSDAGFFNPVLAFGPEVLLDDVEQAVEWVEGHALPCTIVLSDDVDRLVLEALQARGFALDPHGVPVMALDPIPGDLATAAGPLPVGLTVRTGGAELFDDWHAVFDSTERLRALFNRDRFAEPGWRVVVADLDGRPAACSLAVHGAGVIGVYAVQTVEHARRRGVGTAVTRAAIRAGVEAWGSTVAILQSSEMGLGVYQKMGFEIIGRNRELQRPKTG